MKCLIACLFVLVAAPAFAQGTSTAPPTSVDVLVLPATGDPVTIAPVANGTRNTVLTAAMCNQTPIAVPVGTLVNPTTVEVDDVNVAGRKCRVLMPAGLATATSLRVVAVYQSSAGPSGRSLVGSPFFDVASTLVPPAAPTGTGVRP
jgi:hypothetical protein